MELVKTDDVCVFNYANLSNQVDDDTNGEVLAEISNNVKEYPEEMITKINGTLRKYW